MDLITFFGVQSGTELAWIGLGLFAQVMFGMRFIIQWLHSERAKRSVVPLSFWYYSLFGGLMMLAYALYRWDPVFILGQAMGLAVYVRNLVLIHRERRAPGYSADKL